jgi:hypothetical protein
MIFAPQPLSHTACFAALEAAKGDDSTVVSLIDFILTGDFAGALASPFGSSLLLEGATDGEDFDGEPHPHTAQRDALHRLFYVFQSRPIALPPQREQMPALEL